MTSSSFTTDLPDARVRLCVVVEDAAIGSLVEQCGVIVSRRAADALRPFSV